MAVLKLADQQLYIIENSCYIYTRLIKLFQSIIISVKIVKISTYTDSNFEIYWIIYFVY
jgi:hypothetical protein